MRDLAIRLQTRSMELAIPGAASLWEAGAIPTATLCAALLAIAGIHLLKSAEAKSAA